MADLTDFERGYLVGILVGEGSFGGDGKQPHISLRMHTRHVALFEWLIDKLPSTRLYGPYNHGGRSYYQWMARGRALVEDVLPLIEAVPLEDLDGHAAERLQEMLERYGPFIARERARIAQVQALDALESDLSWESRPELDSAPYGASGSASDPNGA